MECVSVRAGALAVGMHAMYLGCMTRSDMHFLQVDVTPRLTAWTCPRGFFGIVPKLLTSNRCAYDEFNQNNCVGLCGNWH